MQTLGAQYSVSGMNMDNMQACVRTPSPSPSCSWSSRAAKGCAASAGSMVSSRMDARSVPCDSRLNLHGPQACSRIRGMHTG